MVKSSLDLDKAQAKEIETTAEVEILRELKVKKKKVLKEMDEIEKTIVKTQEKKKANKSFDKGESVTFEI